ncbi:MAG TPA: DoxX family protein [Stenotrophomonas sp.]|nr:DoxX family protein [Stenotrophomonas sp.]
MTTLNPPRRNDRVAWLITRVLLSLVFLSSGLAKLFDFQGGMADMQSAGLHPAWLFNLTTAAVLLAGAALILLDRWMMVAAVGLSLFLLGTIVLVHHFWSLSGEPAQHALFFALEHLSLIGGLLAAAHASSSRRQPG